MIRWLGLLLLLTFISGCEQTPQHTDKKTTDPVQNKSFSQDDAVTDRSSSSVNLAEVKKQYSDIALKVLDASLQTYRGKPALSLSLSVPLNPAENHQQNLQVMTDDERLVDGAWQLSDNGRQLYFTAIDAETNYHIKVFAELTAATGVNLGKLYAIELKTRAIQASVSFTTQKTVLVANEARGLAVSAINTPQVDIDFFRIDLKKYPQYENSWYGRNQNRGNWELNRALKYSTPVYSGRFELDMPKNSRQTRYIDIAAIDALQPAGFYLAVMKAAASYPDQFSTATFIVSDLGLHVRQYDSAVHVYTSSLKTGQAMQQVKISIMDNKGNTLLTANSDVEGIARFQSLPSGGQFVIGQQGEQIAVVNLQDAALDLSEFNLVKELSGSQSLFIYSARDLYRPGETVDLYALLRNLDGSLPTAQPLKAKLLQPDGQELKSFQWQPGALSSYHYQLQLPRSAKSGLWNLQVEQADQFIQNFAFHVENFLPERLNLVFTDNPSQQDHPLFHADPLEVKVSGEFLYGAPAAGNSLQSFITAQLITEPFPRLAGFKFGNVKDQDKLQTLYLEDVKLDKNGQTSIQAKNPAAGTQSPVRLNISASLLERGGRPVTRQHTLTSLPAEKLVGIRPLYDEGLDHFEANTLANFEVVRVDHNAQLLAASGLQVKLIHERRDYHWVNRGAGWAYEYDEKHYTAYQTKLDIPADKQPAQLQLPLEWGKYRLEIKDPESGLTASTRVTAGSNWWGKQDQAAQGNRPDQIKLSWDKASYQSGETARLTLHPPYAGEGFIAVESNRLLWGKRLSIPAEGLSINIPVSESWKRPDIYATAVIFRPSNQQNLMTPKRAMGLLHLPLDHTRQKLQIDIISPDKIEPNKKLKLQLQASNIHNKEVKVQLMAVDVGVLNITDYQTPDPYHWLFKPRRLRVESHDMYGDIVEYIDADLARQKFGGDADLVKGGEQAKADVQIVSLIQPVVSFDANGQAEFELDIPDFNGRLRIMAIAYGDDQTGSAEKYINVAAPVVAEIAMPRFLARHDQAHITLELQNLTSQNQQLTSELAVSEPLDLASVNKHQLTLSPNQRKLLHYQISANDYAQGKIQLNLSNADNSIRLQREWSLTSRSPYPAESYQFRQVIDKDQFMTLPTGVSESLIPSATVASLRVSNQPPVDISAQVSNLLQYPYGCLEQTGSRIYPLLFADKKAIKRWQLDAEKWTQEQRFKQIDNGFTHISGMQLYNGGFGLWDNNSQEEFWLTAYISQLMLEADLQGIDIPRNQQKKALNRLSSYIKTPLALIGDSRSSQKKAYRFAYKAYAAYVLSRLNKAPLAQLRKLYDFNKDRNESLLPILHMAIALQQQGDNKRAREALQRLSTITRSNQYLADYGSPVRDLAMASYLMLKHQLNIPGQNWLFDLSSELRHRKWLSTQERNALFLLGNLLANQQQDSWSMQLSIGEHHQLIDAKGTKSWRWPWQELQQSIKLTNESQSPLYSSFRISGYPQQTPADSSSGMSIQRHYYNKLGEEIKLDLVKQGKLVIVNLRLESDQSHPDALIVDMLPAGFEIENQNLASSVPLQNMKINQQTIQSLQQKTQIVKTESLDDRFIAAVNISRYQSANIFYLMRAVTPGQYQLPAAFAEDMYQPEVRTIFQGKSSQVIIHARQD